MRVLTACPHVCILCLTRFYEMWILVSPSRPTACILLVSKKHNDTSLSMQVFSKQTMSYRSVFSTL